MFVQGVLGIFCGKFMKEAMSRLTRRILIWDRGKYLILREIKPEEMYSSGAEGHAEVLQEKRRPLAEGLVMRPSLEIMNYSAGRICPLVCSKFHFNPALRRALTTLSICAGSL